MASGESGGCKDGVSWAFRRNIGLPETTLMRNSLVLLAFLGSVSCASLQQGAAPAPPPPATPAPAEVSEATPAKVECSDGTTAVSLEACLINMARARLPPSQQADGTPTRPVETTTTMPTATGR
jgi:hypothetical protein